MKERIAPTNYLAAATLVLAITALACEENPPDATISQFDRPQDVALVCYDTEERTPLPMECCRSQGSSSSGVCSVGLPYARIFAFVTQTTPGEVAVVDLMGQAIVDQETQIPYNSFVPVGGQPSDIAATWDGQRVYTANFETGDLSVIYVMGADGESSVIENPSLRPASSISIDAPAARLVIAQQPVEKRDRIAYVTQPTESRVAVVALNAEDCPSPEEQPHGCLLGYLQINSTGDVDDQDDDNDNIPDGGAEPADGGASSEQGGAHLWSIIASDTTPSLFVSGTDRSFILEIDSDILAEEALALDSPGPLSNSAVVRRIDTEGFTTRALALEPVLERWLYAIENEEGGVLSINLVQGEMVEVEGNSFSIELPGRARALTLLRLGESEEPEPLNFNGTFAVVSTTTAGIFVIDVEDEQPLAPYPHSHSIRSAIDLSSDSEDLPRLTERPVLTIDAEEISDEKSIDYAHFGDIDGGLDEDGGPGDGGPRDGGPLPDGGHRECEPDNGDVFQSQSDFGFRFRCDPSQWSREEWRLTWEGTVGISGAGVIDYQSSDPGAGTMVLMDESKGFCERGLRVREDGDEPDAYAGDVLVITSEPTAVGDAASKCSKKFGDRELEYQIIEVLDSDPTDDTNDDNAIRISNNTEEMLYPSPLPTRECFGQAFSYEVRAYRHWVLNGSSSGILHDGEAVETDNGLTCGQGTRGAEGRTSRVFPSVPFENYYFAFTLYNGQKLSEEGAIDSKEDEDTDEDLSAQDIAFTFVTEGGYAPMVSVVGNNVTDITFTPDYDLVLVDQAGEGLILFDMLHSFGVIGNPVN